jgi:hypothetical protein
MENSIMKTTNYLERVMQLGTDAVNDRQQLIKVKDWFGLYSPFIRGQHPTAFKELQDILELDGE